MNANSGIPDDARGWLDGLRFDERGLLPAVVQDRKSGLVLMLAWVNKEAVAETLESGRTVFWSRSRACLWRKGETSGNYQTVQEILYDCDADSLVIRVDPAGPACHTGHRSCFYRSVRFRSREGEAPRAAEPAEGHGADEAAGAGRAGAGDVLGGVYDTVLKRKETLPPGSYVASLMKGGQDRILKKVAEEAGEVMLASKNGSREEIVYEMADLWFHSLVTLAFHDIPPSEVLNELERRRKPVSSPL